MGMKEESHQNSRRRQERQRTQRNQKTLHILSLTPSLTLQAQNPNKPTVITSLKPITALTRIPNHYSHCPYSHPLQHRRPQPELHLAYSRTQLKMK